MVVLVKKTKNKGIWISLLLLIVLLNPIGGYAPDDSKNSVQIDNDAPPSFVSVFDSTESGWISWIVESDTNVTFWAIIEDIDNTSIELNVTLYYSSDVFITHFLSANLTFVSSPQMNQYQFEYEMSGQEKGTYYQYYYQGFDGETKIKDDNSGLYYVIQWDSITSSDVNLPASITQEPKEEPIEPSEPLTADYMMLILVIIMTIALIIIIIVIAVSNKFNQIDRKWAK